MNKKTKSSIILSSLAAIAVAGSLIAGSTYALFTSESKTNIAATSGKVSVLATIENMLTYTGKDLTGVPADDASKIQLSTAYDLDNGHFMNGGTAELDGNTLTLDKVTPGDKVTFNVNVKNNSNVKTKYRTIVEKPSDDGLYEALSITLGISTWSNGFSVVSPYKELDPVSEETSVSVIPVTIDFPSDKGNDYQDKSCSIKISVEAVQGNAATEEYSEDDIKLYNSDDLYLLADSVNKGSLLDSSFALTHDITLDSTKEWTPIGSYVSVNC